MTSDVLEPLVLFASPQLFSGLQGPIPSELHAQVVTSLDQAMDYAFSQNLGAGLEVWQDVLSAQQAQTYLETDASDWVQAQLASLMPAADPHDRAYRRRRLARLTTPFEDFLRSDASDDACAVLTMITKERYLGISNSLSERLLSLYRFGGWPCGMRSCGHLLVFDPAVLPGAPTHSA